MHQFKDSTGETWELAITGATIKRVWDLLHVDLGKLLDGNPPLLTRLDTEIVLLVDVIYVCLKLVADRRNVSDLDFAGRLSGEALRHAHDALMEELVDFFRQLGRTDLAQAGQEQQALLHQTVAKQTKVIGRAARLYETKLADPRFDAAIDAELEELGESFVSLRPLPDAIPSPEPSGNSSGWPRPATGPSGDEPLPSSPRSTMPTPPSAAS